MGYTKLERPKMDLKRQNNFNEIDEKEKREESHLDIKIQKGEKDLILVKRSRYYKNWTWERKISSRSGESYK